MVASDVSVLHRFSSDLITAFRINEYVYSINLENYRCGCFNKAIPPLSCYIGGEKWSWGVFSKNEHSFTWAPPHSPEMLCSRKMSSFHLTVSSSSRVLMTVLHLESDR